MTALVSIVTPAFNEERNLPEFLRRAYSIVPELERRGASLEVVVVDDHSRDGTPLLMRRAAQEYPRLTYVRLSRNCGPHAAVSAGLKFCTGDCAIIMAADMQDPIEAIPEFLDIRNAGNDVVWAYRTSREGVSWAAKAASKTFYRLMKLLAMPDLPATGSDFFLIDRKVIDAYNLISEKHTNCIALIHWLGFRQTSIPYAKLARREGTSKWTFAKKFKLLIDSIVSFSYVPIRFMSSVGILMALAGFAYALCVVVGRLAGWVTTGTGFSALMTVLLVGQGSIILMLGILGEYLWRTFDEARGRPRYSIEDYFASNPLQSVPQAEDMSS